MFDKVINLSEGAAGFVASGHLSQRLPLGNLGRGVASVAVGWLLRSQGNAHLGRIGYGMALEGLLRAAVGVTEHAAPRWPAAAPTLERVRAAIADASRYD